MSICPKTTNPRGLVRRPFGGVRPVVAMLPIGILVGCHAPAPEPEPAKTEIEMANLDKAVHCMELLELHHDLETAGHECFADEYIQHHPRFPNGKEAVLEAFARRLEDNPDKTISIKRAAVNGDLVWIHLHSQRFPGDEQGNAVVNIFRMEDGRFAEHWGVVQAVPEESANENTMF